MLTTIIFFFAIIFTYLTIRSEFNAYIDDTMTNIMMLISSLLWSWLFYLLH